MNNEAEEITPVQKQLVENYSEQCDGEYNEEG
jgi:hypothetical protein